MSVQALKVAGAGIASAGGSASTVYGIYYLTTKDASPSLPVPITPEVDADSSDTENQAIIQEGDRQPAEVKDDYDTLSEWMTREKCTIAKIHLISAENQTTSIDLVNKPSDQTIIKKLLEWLKTNEPERKKKF